MNREDIIAMARETGVEWLMHNQFYKDHLQHFAALVAAAERKVIMDSLQKQADMATDALDRRWALEMIAAIRARGNT